MVFGFHNWKKLLQCECRFRNQIKGMLLVGELESSAVPGLPKIIARDWRVLGTPTFKGLELIRSHYTVECLVWFHRNMVLLFCLPPCMSF